MKKDKFILSLTVEEITGGYQFTLHNDKKISTVKVNSIGVGFNKVMKILNVRGDVNVGDYVDG